MADPIPRILHRPRLHQRPAPRVRNARHQRHPHTRRRLHGRGLGDGRGTDGLRDRRPAGRWRGGAGVRGHRARVCAAALSGGGRARDPRGGPRRFGARGRSQRRLLAAHGSHGGAGLCPLDDRQASRELGAEHGPGVGQVRSPVRVPRRAVVRHLRRPRAPGGGTEGAALGRVGRVDPRSRSQRRSAVREGDPPDQRRLVPAISPPSEGPSTSRSSPRSTPPASTQSPATPRNRTSQKRSTPPAP